MVGVILAFCLFGFCAGGGHWHHGHRHHVERHHSNSSEADRLIPAGWQPQTTDPRLHQKRFVSPDGQASLTALSVDASDQSPSLHMRDVAFVRDETVHRLNGGDDWVSVSATRGDRIFYRKAVLACAGRKWHEIDLEYPITSARTMDRVAKRVSKALDRSRDDACEAEPAVPPVATTPPSRQPYSGAETVGAGSPSQGDMPKQ